jgi:hypothetical protein
MKQTFKLNSEDRKTKKKEFYRIGYRTACFNVNKNIGGGCLGFSVEVETSVCVDIITKNLSSAGRKGVDILYWLYKFGLRVELLRSFVSVYKCVCGCVCLYLHVCVYVCVRKRNREMQERNKGVGGRVQWPCSTYVYATANALEQNTSCIVLCKSLSPPAPSLTRVCTHNNDK